MTFNASQTYRVTFDAFKTTNKSGSHVLSAFECIQVFWINILDDKEVSKEFFSWLP